jgi:hypothetical protein
MESPGKVVRFLDDYVVIFDPVGAELVIHVMRPGRIDGSPQLRAALQQPYPDQPLPPRAPSWRKYKTLNIQHIRPKPPQAYPMTSTTSERNTFL